MNTLDMTTYLATVFTPYVSSLRLNTLELDGFTPAYEIHTLGGRLRILLMDDWLACRFDDVEKAAKLFGITTIQQGRLNPYSGKWNWHWFDGVPEQGGNPTRKNMRDGIDKMVGLFAEAVEKIRP